MQCLPSSAAQLCINKIVSKLFALKELIIQKVLLTTKFITLSPSLFFFFIRSIEIYDFDPCWWIHLVNIRTYWPIDFIINIEREILFILFFTPSKGRITLNHDILHIYRARIIELGVDQCSSFIPLVLLVFTIGHGWGGRSRKSTVATASARKGHWLSLSLSF